eukprot:TRINITY_DN57295_c0_g1_i1.p1 TRINITY_DN57295_c0_g1~~TRINITY_DN57295_c0_g1_i1.p1  ORF type:complete len:154 (+),score=24.25 TRINITY_DN57295_c0_g1_i1:82-543(+)
MLIADLLAEISESNITTHGWADVYKSCCSLNHPTNRCWQTCGGCCCVDIDFAHIRSAMNTYYYSVAQAEDSKLDLALHRLPEVYVAGKQATLQCFTDVTSWRASADPLGVLALRLFYLEAESLRAQREVRQLNEVERRDAMFTWALLQEVLVE